MTRFIFNIIVLAGFAVLIGAAPQSAYAQSRSFDRSYMANPKYDFMVRQAERLRSENFRFDQFRVYYTQTRQYDPIGEKTLTQLQDYAFAVQYGNDPLKEEEALKAYDKLLKDHLANLKILAQALALSREDSRLGNPQFLSWVRDGIVKNVMDSGDGKTLQGAYDVITLAEETAIFLELGLKPLKTQAAHEGYYYYNLHDVEDLRTGQKSSLFVNTTYPMQFLEEKKGGAGNVLSIQRQ